MRNANRPTGPGKPTQERRDSATAREELQEMTDEALGETDAPQRDPTRSARQAERDAHVSGQHRHAASGTSGNRRRG
jgi:hypothetical protein